MGWNHQLGVCFLGGGLKDVLCLPRSLGRWSKLTSIFFNRVVQPVLHGEHRAIGRRFQTYCISHTSKVSDCPLLCWRLWRFMLLNSSTEALACCWCKNHTCQSDQIQHSLVISYRFNLFFEVCNLFKIDDHPFWKRHIFVATHFWVDNFAFSRVCAQVSGLGFLNQGEDSCQPQIRTKICSCFQSCISVFHLTSSVSSLQFCVSNVRCAHSCSHFYWWPNRFPGARHPFGQPHAEACKSDSCPLTSSAFSNLPLRPFVTGCCGVGRLLNATLWGIKLYI